jgi:hypothetical protein
MNRHPPQVIAGFGVPHTGQFTACSATKSCTHFEPRTHELTWQVRENRFHVVLVVVVATVVVVVVEEMFVVAVGGGGAPWSLLEISW